METVKYTYTYHMRTAQTAQTMSPYIQGCRGGVPQSPGSCPESESDSESASKSRTLTQGTRPVSSVVLDTNGCPVDRLLIKKLRIFILCLTAFHTLSLLYFPLLHFSSVQSTPAFSTPAFSAPPSFCWGYEHYWAEVVTAHCPHEIRLNSVVVSSTVCIVQY